jgi:hypothetical protein
VRLADLLLALSLSALPTLAMASPGVEVTGSVLTDVRTGIEDGRLLWNENRLALEVDASPGEDAHVFAEFWVRGSGFSQAESSADLMGLDRRKSNPRDVVFREAYVDLYGIILPDLDLRIGRQRIAWGTGDQINPTDNINPDDFEDIWDFGRHVPGNSVLATYYRGAVTLSGVFVPAFAPATFPPARWAGALASAGALPDGLTVSGMSDRLHMPDETLKKGASAAAKAAWPLLGYDLSLSCYRGRSDIPLASRVVLTPGAASGVHVASELVYPRLTVVGADMSGAVGSVGVWAEMAVSFPDEVRLTIDGSAVGEALQTSVALEGDPFVKYVVGADYTFHSGLYVNGQFVHGFAHELGADALHDYLAGGVEKRLRHDTVKLTLAAAAETPRLEDSFDDLAIVGMPEIAYYPADGSEVALGVRLIQATGETSFGQLDDMDEVYLTLKYAF